MFRNLKRLIALNRNFGDAEEHRDADGRTVVSMTVRDDAEFLSPYSANDAPLLNEAVVGFLNQSLRPRCFGDDLTVEIRSDCIDEEERELYQTAFRNTYRFAYASARQTVKRDALTAVIMLLTGILFLGAMFLMAHLGAGDLWIEVVDIFAWVFLWEAADVFFLERKLNRMEQLRAAGFYEAKLKFLPLTGKDDAEAAASDTEARNTEATELLATELPEKPRKEALKDAESLLFSSPIVYSEAEEEEKDR